MSILKKDWILKKLFSCSGYVSILPFALMAVIAVGKWKQDGIL